MTAEMRAQFVSPFNGPVEIGLRALCVLTTAFPTAYALQRLVVFDYFLVHSDDIEGGPEGLHPRTPHRGGEILVRRGVLQEGLTLYESRGLVERIYRDGGIFFAATDKSADFLDTLSTEYLKGLRERADWIVDSFGPLADGELDAMVRERIGTWGAEFLMESVLWTEDAS
ncbi:MAG: threonine transporter [Thermoanaerobaculia bacterium]|nr:MAG: threonine transporter [Thermoanaerobaculia bacterium]